MLNLWWISCSMTNPISQIGLACELTAKKDREETEKVTTDSPPVCVTPENKIKMGTSALITTPVQHHPV